MCGKGIAINCRVKDDHPLQGKCLAESIVHRAKVKANNTDGVNYIRLTENNFKDRLYKHRNEKKRRSTKLSKHICNLKDQNTAQYSIEWSIDKAAAYKNGSKRCEVCL